MNNLITLFLATLVHLGVITKVEGDRLNEEMQTATLPSDFESAYEMVKDIFDRTDVEIRDTLKK